MKGDDKTQKIKEVLEENLGLNWVDRLVYNHYTESYHSADIFDFYPNRPTYAYLKDNKNKAYLARVVLNDESFIINLNGMKIDASEHWKELLSQDTIEIKIK